MKTIGTFDSKRWGKVTAARTKYADGNLAVLLIAEDQQTLTKLSTNIASSDELPPNCFHVKTWSENTELAREAYDSGLFTERLDLPTAHTGFVDAPVWECKQS